MNPGYGPDHDVSGEPAPVHGTLADRHEAGLVDELGERRLVFDGGPTPSAELLCFRQALTATPGFEVALRRRVQQLSVFRHPSFVRVRGVQYLARGQGLALVSTYTAGRRLSELLSAGRDPWFAAALIRQLTPALAALHAQGGGIAHGALAASRIVVTPEGRLTILEHVLGSALERLELPAARLSLTLGIAVPSTERTAGPTFDSRTDLFQLGLTALSLLHGRWLSAEEARTSAGTLLDEVFPPAEEPAVPLDGLRAWLRCALQLDDQIFRSSDDAVAALKAWPAAALDQADRQWRELVRRAEPSETPAETQTGGAGVVTWPGSNPVAGPAAPPAPAALDAKPDMKGALSSSPRSGYPETSTTKESGKPTTRLRALVGGLAACAIAEAFVIALLLQTRPTTPSTAPFDIQIETPDPGASVVVDGRSAGLTPLKLTIGADTQLIRVAGPAGGTVLPVGSTGEQTTAAAPERSRAEAGAADPPPAAAPAAQRTGGLRLVTPIELDVFEGDRRLGSSATGIVSVAAGRHELELVNSVLGFRIREQVEVKGGQVVSVTVAPPNGVVNINALPWAEVWIDGKSVGQTPIGNLSLPIGEHDVLFRHPQLGERRQTAVVRVDGVTRVSVNFQRQPPPR